MLRTVTKFHKLPKSLLSVRLLQGPSSPAEGVSAETVNETKKDTAGATKAPSETPPQRNPAHKGIEQYPGEISGPKGPEPTRYGDWEKGGRVSDF
ncbi:hypothetical protein BSKO_07424 [Bryopsis sp. KO-2023]|nr:hypothetical protein BSKO_07424 [Bryopsis sp. KO-2023]